VGRGDEEFLTMGKKGSKIRFLLDIIYERPLKACAADQQNSPESTPDHRIMYLTKSIAVS